MAGVNMVRQLSATEGSEGRQVLMRTPSAASDATTWSANLSVPQANPAPAYTAQIATSELVSKEVGRTVLVTHSALTLLNEFLDQVLYNILLASRSTSLGSLKAAVPMVLRPRLGKAAVKVAEDELKEYLNDDEELELQSRANTAEIKQDFDADLAWRLARLRCMVYTRLGDLEEEDEEEWLHRDGLLVQLQAAKQHSPASVETGPPSAIFLTSIIEYLGEQALYYAAQHAQKRQHQNGGQQAPEGEVEPSETSSIHEIVVAGKDMNHVGRDSPLARLWRSYRRNTRDSSSRPMSPGDRTSYGQPFFHSRGVTSMSSDRAAETRLPDQIPLPMSTNDVNEIEVPGLAPAYSDDEEETQDSSPQKRRPVSMVVMPGAFQGTLGAVQSEAPEVPEKSHLRPAAGRTRSISSPVPRLAKPNVSSENLMHRDDSFAREYRKDTADRSSVANEQAMYSPDEEQKTSSSSRDMAGGAAIIGALGVGALGVVRHNDSTTKTAIRTDWMNAEETAHDEVTLPRKTVAEEMLGVSPVAPPKDATTGASITNMSDFYSMHVPVAMSPSPSILQASPVTPLPNKDGDYFPTSSKKSQDVLPGNEGSTFPQTDGPSDISTENLKPAPLRTMSGRIATTQPAPVSGQRTAPKVTTDDTVLDRSNALDVDQLASATTVSTNDSRPQSSGSAVLGTAISFVPPRGASAQVRHTKVGSRSSLNSPHSRNVSAGGQMLDPMKDTAGRTSTSPQSRTVAMLSSQTRATPTSSVSTTSRDPNSGAGTSNNSVSKRFHGKPIQIGDESDEAKKKSLEVLIRGNETLHYTLTPAAALRDEKIRTQSSEMSDPIRSANVPTQESGSHINPDGIVSGSNAPKSPSRIVPRMTTPTSSMGVVTAASPTRSKNPLGQPRDARTEKSSSIRDLADYARSTGPLDPKQLPQSIGLPSSPKPTATSPRINQAAREPASPNDARSSSRLKYQARDARPSRTEDTSGLIEFIREGPPPSGKEVKDHRIDRRVAPFRTTMDSEDFDGLVPGRGIESSLRGSEDERPTASVDPSITSQSPLIVSNGLTGKGVVPAGPSGNNMMDSDGMPKKTRRKAKDPYAIYDSDDEEDMEALRTKNQEESLIDFLRNSAPPPGMTTQPILAARPGQRSPDQSTVTTARETSPHLTQSGSKIDKYRPTQPTHASHVGRRRSQQSSPASKSESAIKTEKPRPKARFEARDAKATRANTFELAEYLKNSGPPPNAQYQPQPFILSTNPLPPKASTPAPAVKDDSTMFKRFSKQRKK